MSLRSRFLFVLAATFALPLFADPLPRRTFLQTVCAAAMTSAAPASDNRTGNTTVKWEVIGPDSETPVRSGRIVVAPGTSARDLTARILGQNRISFVETEHGLTSIMGTPSGADAVVILNDGTRRVYGWCYEVDGVQPGVKPADFHFQNQNSVLRWFYAFSESKNGQWISYCTPSHKAPSR